MARSTLAGAAAAAARPPATPATEAVPLCRVCGVSMFRKDPRPQCGDTWRPFWGCPNYSRCRNTVDIA